MKVEPIDPHASAWHLFGAVMRRLREYEPKIALRRAARDLYVDFSNLSKWERGERVPPPDMVARIDEVYRAKGILTALYGTLMRLTAAAESERLRPGMSLENPAYRDGDDEMERRAALQLLAGLSTIGMSGEPLRQWLIESPEELFRPIAEWDAACTAHLYALRTQPAARVAEDLLVDLFAVRSQAKTAGPADEIELERILAVLADMQGNALSRLGEHGAAIRWWRTARLAADASGDLDLRLLVRGDEAGHGLYGQRDPAVILPMIDQAEKIAGGPTADLLSTKAKALSLLGRNDEALRCLRDLQAAAEKGIVWDRYGFWTDSRIYFTESWVYAASGDEAAYTGREGRLLRSRDYNYRTNVQLHGALCMVAQGGVDEGLRHASATIAELRPDYRSHHILETGRMVLRAVPSDQRLRSSAAEFREVLNTVPGGGRAAR